MLRVVQTCAALWVSASLGISIALADDSLYQRLGGRESLSPMVSDYIDMIGQDNQLKRNSSVKKYLGRANSAELKNRLYETVCEATGGPCKAEAARASLKKTIHSLELSSSEWDSLVADFSAEVSKFKVTNREQTELKALLNQARESAVAGTN
jgi:hemoglobin